MLWTIYPCESKPLSAGCVNGLARLSSESILMFLCLGSVMKDRQMTSLNSLQMKIFNIPVHFKVPTGWNVRKLTIVFCLQLLSLMWII